MGKPFAGRLFSSLTRLAAPRCATLSCTAVQGFATTDRHTHVAGSVICFAVAR